MLIERIVLKRKNEIKHTHTSLQIKLFIKHMHSSIGKIFIDHTLTNYARMRT